MDFASRFMSKVEKTVVEGTVISHFKLKVFLLFCGLFFFFVNLIHWRNV